MSLAVGRKPQVRTHSERTRKPMRKRSKRISTGLKPSSRTFDETKVMPHTKTVKIASRWPKAFECMLPPNDDAKG